MGNISKSPYVTGVGVGTEKSLKREITVSLRTGYFSSLHWSKDVTQ